MVQKAGWLHVRLRSERGIPCGDRRGFGHQRMRGMRDIRAARVRQTRTEDNRGRIDLFCLGCAFKGICIAGKTQQDGGEQANERA